MRAILTFHSIDSGDTVLSYPQDGFAQLLAGLSRARMPILARDALLQPLTRRGVALTFDDGFQSVFTDALPVLRDHGAPAHLFLTTGLVRGDNCGRAHDVSSLPMLDWKQVEALHAAGVRMESHTANHPDLRTLADASIAAECDAADRVITARLGRHPRYFAYPYGANDERVRAIIRSRYAAALTTDLRPLRRHEDAAALPRFDSYYLRVRWIQRGLDTRPARVYLALRHVLRLIQHQR